MEPVKLNVEEQLLPAQRENEDPSNEACPSRLHGIGVLIAFGVKVIRAS